MPVLRHELRHVTQWAWWGPAFLPAYALCALWSLLATGDLAVRNGFERSAHLVEGGYNPDIGLRPSIQSAVLAARGVPKALANAWTRPVAQWRRRTSSQSLTARSGWSKQKDG